MFALLRITFMFDAFLIGPAPPELPPVAADFHEARMQIGKPQSLADTRRDEGGISRTTMVTHQLIAVRNAKFHVSPFRMAGHLRKRPVLARLRAPKGLDLHVNSLLYFHDTALIHE